MGFLLWVDRKYILLGMSIFGETENHNDELAKEAVKKVLPAKRIAIPSVVSRVAEAQGKAAEVVNNNVNGLEGGTWLEKLAKKLRPK